MQKSRLKTVIITRTLQNRQISLSEAEAILLLYELDIRIKLYTKNGHIKN